MSESSIRLQTYIVCGVMIGCFSILYPKIFHPILLRSLGIIKSGPVEQEHPIPPRFGPHGPDRPRPSIRGADSDSPNAAKRGGILSLVLPAYGVGIVIYLFYTLSKLYKSRQRKNDKQKDEYLRHYYRDFHYDVNRGEFRMGRDSSDNEDEGNSHGDGHATTSVLSSSQDQPATIKSKPMTSRKNGFENLSGRFDWAAAYGTDIHPDIYRSAKSLPRDLEELLYRMENQEIVDDEELSTLRMRLEQTEREMMRLLHAMYLAEQLVTQPSDEEELEDDAANGVEAALYSSDRHSRASQHSELRTARADYKEPSEMDRTEAAGSQHVADTAYECGKVSPVVADEEIRQRDTTR